MAENKHDDQHEQHRARPRVSLRGKGREIMLGQHSDLFDEDAAVRPDRAEPTHPDEVDASSLPLTPEETDALLDFADSAPDIPLPDPDAFVSMGPESPEDLPAWWEHEEAVPAELAAASLLAEELVDEDRDEDLHTFEPAHEDYGARDVSPHLSSDAAPLAERSFEQLTEIVERDYHAHPEVDRLIPREPEIWRAEPQTEDYALHERGEHEGGVIVPEGAAVIKDPVPVGLPEPFEPVYERQPAERLFGRTEPADPDMLHLLVDDEAIRKLAQQIEALQEELAEHVRSDRDPSDVYMTELLRAYGLLMASRENYDDAKAIVLRVRADMNRERKVEADIIRYRPQLLLYYICWGITLGVLFLLKALFVGITDAVGVEAFAAMYNPMLFGIAGALLSGYLTLERHTTKLRDFDPAHVSWYLFNPLLGSVMGLIMFLIAAIANEDLLQDSGSTAERAITYLLCVVAGMNQNTVLRQLNSLLERVSPGKGD